MSPTPMPRRTSSLVLRALLPVLLWAMLAVAACRKDEKAAAGAGEAAGSLARPAAPSGPGSGPGQAAPGDGPGPANAPDTASPTTPAPAPDPAMVRERAQALIKDWLDAQNRGDFPAYIALYDAERFTGIKRVHTGKITRMDLAAWKTDRGRMFRRPMTVAAEDIQMSTWLDAGAGLPRGVTSLGFVQRWKSGAYADHGPKVLRLLWTGDRHRIVYEDMIASERGWAPEPGPRAAAVEAVLQKLGPYSDPAPIIAGLDRDMLVEVARLGGCEAAMLAAERLSDMGDDTFLPRRPDRDDPDRMARVLCMLPHDMDSDRGLAVFRSFLPPAGEVSLSMDECLDEGEEPDEIPPITRKTADDLPFDQRFGGIELMPCTPGKDAGAVVCDGYGSGEGYQITLAPAADGKLYIRAIDHYRLTGCGC